MSHQAFANKQTLEAYWAKRSLEDDVLQLQESVAYSSLTQPQEDTITTWDDQGTGTYPLTDNRGATKTTTVKLIDGDMSDLNSQTFLSNPANPGTTQTLWVNSSDSNKLYYGPDPVDTSGLTGDVIGPASATDNALVRFDTTTGKLIQDGTITQSDTGTLQNIEAFEMTKTSSNPGGIDTFWQNDTTQHLMRGECCDIENYFTYKQIGSVLGAAQTFISHCKISGNGERIVVGSHTQNRAYVFRREGNTWVEEQELIGSGVDTGDEFGRNVGINYYGDYICVGAHRNDSGATEAGKAFIYNRVGTTWSEQDTIQGTIRSFQRFGQMPIFNKDGTKLVAGGDNSTFANPEAYVFSRSGSVWTLDQTLLPALGISGSRYGTSCEMTPDGERIFITAPYYSSTGRVWVWKWNGAAYAEEANFTGSSAVNGFGGFGFYAFSGIGIDATGTLLFVGSRKENTGDTDSGAAYVFQRTGTSWAEIQRILPPQIIFNGEFGINLACNHNGSILAIGGNGHPVYIFKKNADAYYESQNVMVYNGLNGSGYYGITMDSSGEWLGFQEGSPTNEVYVFRAIISDQVTAPYQTTENNIPIFDSTDGRLIKDSGIAIGSLTVGAGSSTDNAVARFNGTSGDLQDTPGFTCDDDYNVKIGDSTSNVDRCLHIQGKQSACLFIEADTDNATETDVPLIVMHYDGGDSHLAIGADSVTDNSFKFISASGLPGDTTVSDIVFEIGGEYTAPAVGTMITNYDLTAPTEVLRLDNTDKSVRMPTTLRVDNITEYTTNAGTTIEGTTFENDGMDMTTAAANPGGANTVWQRTSDGHLFRGAVDLEDTVPSFDGFFFKKPVRLATTANVTNGTNGIASSYNHVSVGGASGRGQITAILAVSDTFTVDGVNLGAADDGTRILFKDQIVANQNGIWTTTISGTSLTLDRATDFDADSEVVANASVFVSEGNTNADICFTLTTNDDITIGGLSGTLLTFAPIAGDVFGPASATNNAICRFDTTTGKLIKNTSECLLDTDGTRTMTFRTSTDTFTPDTPAYYMDQEQVM
jgi:hypothetical protein